MKNSIFNLPSIFFSVLSFSVVDIINSSSTDPNEYDIRYDEDLLAGNEIYPSFYNAGGQLTIARISFLFAIVTISFL